MLCIVFRIPDSSALTASFICYDIKPSNNPFLFYMDVIDYLACKFIIKIQYCSITLQSFNTCSMLTQHSAPHRVLCRDVEFRKTKNCLCQLIQPSNPSQTVTFDAWRKSENLKRMSFEFDFLSLFQEERVVLSASHNEHNCDTDRPLTSQARKIISAAHNDNSNTITLPTHCFRLLWMLPVSLRTWFL